MTIVVAGDALVEVLQQAQEFSEVRDTKGNVLGYYAPICPASKGNAPGPSPEEAAELERIRAAGGPYRTLREVFERLLTLTDDPASQADLQRHIEILKERGACDSR